MNIRTVCNEVPRNFRRNSLGGAALGWTLLHSLWEGAVCAMMLGVVMLATKSPRVRYTAGCVAMLAMVGAFG